MPYKDRERQLAYNRTWAKRHPASAADGPLCREIESLLLSRGPLSPSEINALLRRPTTTNTIGSALFRLRAAGRAKNEGYGKWVAS